MGDLLEAENFALQQQIDQLSLQLEHLQGTTQKLTAEKEELAAEKAQLLVEKEAWAAEKKALEERVASGERVIQQLRTTVLFLQEELVKQAHNMANAKSPGKARPVVAVRKQPKKAPAAGDGDDSTGAGAGPSQPNAKSQDGTAAGTNGEIEGEEAAGGPRLSRRAAETVMTTLQESQEAIQQAVASDREGQGCLWWDGIRQKGARVEVMTDVGTSWEPATVADFTQDSVEVRYDNLQTDEGTPLAEWHPLPWAADREPERHGVGFKLRPPQPKELWGDPRTMKKGDIMECWVPDEGAFYPVEILGKKRGRAATPAANAALTATQQGPGQGQEPGTDAIDSGTEGGDDGEGGAGPSNGAAGNGNGNGGGTGRAAAKMCWVSYETVDGDMQKAQEAGSSALVPMSNLRVPYAWLGCRWERLLGERPGPGRKPGAGNTTTAGAAAKGSKKKPGPAPGATGKPRGRPPGPSKVAAAAAAAADKSAAAHKQAAGPGAAKQGGAGAQGSGQAAAPALPQQKVDAAAPPLARGGLVSSQPAGAAQAQRPTAASKGAAAGQAPSQVTNATPILKGQATGAETTSLGLPGVPSPINALKPLAIRQTGLAAPPPRPKAARKKKGKQQQGEGDVKGPSGEQQTVVKSGRKAGAGRGGAGGGASGAAARGAADKADAGTSVAAAQQAAAGDAMRAADAARGTKAGKVRGSQAIGTKPVAARGGRGRKPEPEKPKGVQKVKAAAKLTPKAKPSPKSKPAATPAGKAGAGSKGKAAAGAATVARKTAGKETKATVAEAAAGAASAVAKGSERNSTGKRRASGSVAGASTTPATTRSTRGTAAVSAGRATGQASAKKARR